MKIVKKTLTVEICINFNFNYPRTNKTVKILGMSLRLKNVRPVYKTYPITEIKMHWLIQWHLQCMLILRCESVVILLSAVIS